MKEEWLFPEAVVPVDAETTAALVAEIHRLIDVVGGMALAQPEQEPFGYFQYSIQLDAWVQNRIDKKGAAFYTAGDIRALKHRIHELEGELIGYKKIVADQDAMLEHQTARIVGLQDEIRNLTGEE